MIEYKSQCICDSDDILIDVHSHCGGMDFSNFLHNRYPCSQDIIDLYFKSEGSKVAHQVVFPMPTSSYYDISVYWKSGVYKPSGFCDFPFQKENEYLLKAVENLPFPEHHFLPFLSFSLQDKVKEQERNLVKSFNKRTWGAWGLKFHTSVDQKNAMQIDQESQFIDIITEKQIPLLIHTGFNECSDPMKVIELASRHPYTHICAAHFGAFSKEFAKQLDDYPYKNLFFDTSGLFSLCRYIKESGRTDVVELNYDNPLEVLEHYYLRFPRRFLWGTDSPWYNSVDLNEKKTLIKPRSYLDEAEFISTFDKAQIKTNTIFFLTQGW